MTIFISYYIRRYTITTNISLIHENVFLIIQKDVFLYNKNIYCYYTSSCIITINILLYIVLYNDNKYFIIHRLV